MMFSHEIMDVTTIATALVSLVSPIFLLDFFVRLTLATILVQTATHSLFLDRFRLFLSVVATILKDHCPYHMATASKFDMEITEIDLFTVFNKLIEPTPEIY